MTNHIGFFKFRNSPFNTQIREDWKGGEYFYCSHCDECFHADMKVARNMIQIQDFGAVSGKTRNSCPT